MDIGNGINARAIGVSRRGWVLKLRGLVSVAEAVGAIAASPQLSAVSSGAEEPENLSEVLVKISIALQGLGWERSQVQGVLWERYGVKSLHYLTPVQLLDWLDYLSSH